MKKLPAQFSKVLNLDPLNLDVGARYCLSDSTPLMPELNPVDPLEAIQNIQTIRPSGVIEILAKSKGSFTPWYNVAVVEGRRKVGEGWINSSALIGQNLKKEQ